MTRSLKKYRKGMHYVQIGMGVVLMAVGSMLFLGTFNLLSRYGLFVDLGL